MEGWGGKRPLVRLIYVGTYICEMTSLETHSSIVFRCNNARRCVPRHSDHNETLTAKYSPLSSKYLLNYSIVSNGPSR